MSKTKTIATSKQFISADMARLIGANSERERLEEVERLYENYLIIIEGDIEAVAPYDDQTEFFFGDGIGSLVRIELAARITDKLKDSGYIVKRDPEKEWLFHISWNIEEFENNLDPTPIHDVN